MENGDFKDWLDVFYSMEYVCFSCGISYEEIEFWIFSFNSFYGVCDVCGGLGIKEFFDMSFVVLDEDLLLSVGVIVFWWIFGVKVFGLWFDLVVLFFKFKKIFLEMLWIEWMVN